MSSLATDIDLKKFLPDCYKGILEVEAEQEALSIEINKLNATFKQAMMDQFIQYCSLKAINYYEQIFDIIPDPATETLEMRRERILNRMRNLRPPYTKWYLRRILDNFFGVGNYSLEIDNDNFIITIESSSDNSFWYHEVQVTMTAIKPCNMIYINKPKITTQLLTNETVYSAATTRNYKLDGTWYLGLRPFISIGDEEVRKMPSVSSVQQHFIDENLTNWQSLVSKVIINDDNETSDLTITQQTDSITIEYFVDTSITTTITNIKIVDSDDLTLFNSNVYIPIDDSVNLKHILTLREGV